jgi:hypothetical protein
MRPSNGRLIPWTHSLTSTRNKISPKRSACSTPRYRSVHFGSRVNCREAAKFVRPILRAHAVRGFKERQIALRQLFDCVLVELSQLRVRPAGLLAGGVVSLAPFNLLAIQKVLQAQCRPPSLCLCAAVPPTTVAA